MPDNRRSTWSWALYDWANSAFATTIMAGFFPVFFKKYWSTEGTMADSTFYLGLANSAASIIVALLAPFLGAVADRGSAKKKFLFLFTFLGTLMTGGLWMVGQGQWQLAVLFYVGGNIGFSGGIIFYDSLLPGIASRERMDIVSSLGYALGYIGGGLLFLLNVVMYQKPDLFGIPDGPTAIRLSFLSVAIWWAVFSIPLFLFVREPFSESKTGLLTAVRLGWRQLADTFRELRHLRIVGIFLLAYWVYIDGVDTIIRMAVDYGLSIGFQDKSLIIALLMVQFIAFPAALFYGWLGTRIGTKRAILIAIGGYGFITFMSYFMHQEWHFYGLAAFVGLFQGGIQALSRSLYARLIPVKKAAQFYGFYDMLGKFAVVIGPVLMAVVAKTTGNVRISILSVLILFIVGGYLLLRVDVEEGERIAREYLSRD